MEDTSSVSELLQPSLAGGKLRQQPLSDTATVVISFLGGAPAAILAGVFNARRMGRAAWDGYLAAALFAAWLGCCLLFFRSSGAASVPEWLGQGRLVRTFQQGTGLLVCGAFFLAQRAARRAAALLDGPPPRPWLPGLVMVLLGHLVIGVVLWWGGQFG